MKSGVIENEIELMQALRLGQEEVFQLLFNKLFASLCFYSLKITNDQVASEDIAEESLIKIWERRQTFFQYNVMKSYLYTTVKNSSINWSKQRKYQAGVRKQILYVSQDSEEQIITNIIKSEVIGQVKIFIKTMEPNTQNILHLIFFEGKKIREIALILGLSEGTVKVHKAKALSLLRKHILFFTTLFL